MANFGVGSATAVVCGCVTSAFGQAPAELGPGFDQSPRERARDALAGDPAMQRVPGSLLVMFSDDVTAAERDVTAALAGSRARRHFDAIGPFEHLWVEDADRSIEAIAALPWVEFVEQDVVGRGAHIPNDEFFFLQWGLLNDGTAVASVAGADARVTQAWDTTFGDPNFVIAIVDSGIDLDHPDLDANIWINVDEVPGNGVDDDLNGFIDDVYGWDFYSNDNDPDDLHGHGTHVAGTVAAEIDNMIGVVGVAPACQVMALRWLGPDNRGFVSDALACLNYAVANGVRLSNHSWLADFYSSSMDNAFLNAQQTADHLMVCAAGNDGVNNDVSPTFPASLLHQNIISVANATSADVLASSSSYGAAAVDLAAPGSLIASTYAAGTYVYSSGTSMAAPHVSGVAALLWSMDPRMSAQDVKDRILSTARTVEAYSGVVLTGGFLNAAAAVAATEQVCAADLTGPGGTLPGSVTFGVPDGETDLDDLGFFLNRWFALDLGHADLTTTGTQPGTPRYARSDGKADLDDLGYYITLWLGACD
ncbi:MAG: S8 family peptidase [Planctomycetota bacterium]